MIFHDSQADFYRSPFGAVSSRQDILLRLEVDKKIQTQNNSDYFKSYCFPS